MSAPEPLYEALLSAGPGDELPTGIETLLGRPTWHANAACRDADTNVFFPTGKGSNYDKAHTYCAVCPMAEPCLAQALDDEATPGAGSRNGMYGGHTPNERRDLARMSPMGDVSTAVDIPAPPIRSSGWQRPPAA